MNEAERQARANIAPEILREMERVCPTRMMRDIAMRDNRAPTGPSSQGIIPSSQQLSNVRPGGGAPNVPGGGTGWMRETPIGPPPGIRYDDAQMDAQDERDKADLERAEAMRKLRR